MPHHGPGGIQLLAINLWFSSGIPKVFYGGGLMRCAVISIFLVALFFPFAHASVHAYGPSVGSERKTIGVGTAPKKPRYRRYANPQSRRGHDSGGGIGLSITIDPSKILRGRKKKPAPTRTRRPTTKKRKPAKRRVTRKPGTAAPCPKHLVALMGDAKFWREQAEIAEAEAAMARDAARGWHTIAKQAAEGAAYAGKSGQTSSQKFLEDYADVLEQRAKDYEERAKDRELEAQLLHEMADAEDTNRAAHEKGWCKEYGKSRQTAFSPESVKISTAPGKPGGSAKPDPVKTQYESAEKAQADARLKDRVAEAEKEKERERARKAGSKQDERDQEKEYREPGDMHLDKKHYTADDMKKYAERWKEAPDQSHPVIEGLGYAIGTDILELAVWRPDLAATLLNKLSELKTDDLAGALEVVKLIRQQTQGAHKIATEFGKTIENWGTARMDRAVERMETTLERLIRRESKPELGKKPPASTTTAEKTPNDGTKTPIPVAFTPVPIGLCFERTFILEGDADYLREQADAKDAEAATYREAAKGWRKISGQSADDAKRAKKAKRTHSQQFQENKAAELEQRAKDYEARADKKAAETKALRAKADAEDKERAELEKERCKSLEDRPRNAFSPEPVKVSTKPEDPNSSKPPAQPKPVCGPDITDNVFRVLDKIHSDWKSWNSSKKGEKCTALMTSLSAWDIRPLAPGNAPPTEEWYEEHTWDGTGSLNAKWKKYLQKHKFFFETDAAACSKPRFICTNTVTFLGKCIDPQQVNYVQWGVMNRLCNRDGLAKIAHGLYSATAPGATYDSQKIMAGIGSAYTAATNAGSHYNPQSTDPGEKQEIFENVRKLMVKKLKGLMADPANSDFGSRPAIKCSVPCQMTAAEKDKLSKRNFGYDWGK